MTTRRNYGRGRAKYSALAALLLLAFSLWKLAVPAKTTPGQVERVVDGDTLQVAGEGGKAVRVRLEGIDAPEHGQPFGDRAAATLRDLAEGKAVTLAGDKHDRYGRLVATVRVGDLNVNLEMVKRGMAWHYRQYKQDRALEDAERSARSAHLGLWRQDRPTAPWDYRKSHSTR